MGQHSKGSAYPICRKSTVCPVLSCQVKVMMKYPTHPLGLLKLKIVKIPNVGDDVEKLGVSYLAGKNVKWFIDSGK